LRINILLWFGDFQMFPSAYWIEEYPSQPSDWPIDGLLCPYITILSGQPKVGKSTISLHMVMAMINGEKFLGRETNLGNKKVAWMGFDSGWVNELRKNSEGKVNGSLLLQNPLRSLRVEDWQTLGENLTADSIGFFVIDHLYGLGGHLNLNENQEASKIMTCLQVLNSNYHIPILLLGQATKNQRGAGSMAHSNLFKGNARVLLELAGTRRDGKRSLTVSGNEVASETLQVFLKPTSLDLAEVSKDEGKKQQRDYEANLLKGQKIWESAQPEDLSSQAAAGRLAHKLGMSTNAEAGRKMVSRLVRALIFELDGPTLIQGRNYFT
jgi:hypothetical protein